MLFAQVDAGGAAYSSLVTMTPIAQSLTSPLPAARASSPALKEVPEGGTAVGLAYEALGILGSYDKIVFVVVPIE